MFGRNLRLLCQPYASVSAPCRVLGINRTQFNRYLCGERFPRPDILQRICAYFKVDARILLQPLHEVQNRNTDVIFSNEMEDLLTAASSIVNINSFPSGFYRFSERSFVGDQHFIQGLIFVYRKNKKFSLRGMEAKEAISGQGLASLPKIREFRGFVIAQEGGIAALVFRRGSMSCSFNFLTPVPSFENNYWLGYSTRKVQEKPTGDRVTRLVYEHLGQN
ncbi:helix-turn-helix domain-containing protein [bacterium]|nr:helix-turn-helix domain-containing protein [bacterium]